MNIGGNKTFGFWGLQAPFPKSRRGVWENVSELGQSQHSLPLITQCKHRVGSVFLMCFQKTGTGTKVLLHVVWTPQTVSLASMEGILQTVSLWCVWFQKTGAGIKVYSTCCPNSTDRIVGITGKRKVVVGCVEEIIELLQSVSSWYFWQTCIWPVIVLVWPVSVNHFCSLTELSDHFWFCLCFTHFLSLFKKNKKKTDHVPVLACTYFLVLIVYWLYVFYPDITVLVDQM